MEFATKIQLSQKDIPRLVDVKLQFAIRVRRSALDGDAIAQDAGSSPRPSFAIAGRKLKGVHERSDSSRVESSQVSRWSRRKKWVLGDGT